MLLIDFIVFQYFIRNCIVDPRLKVSLLHHSVNLPASAMPGSSSNPYKTFIDNIGNEDYYTIRMALDTWLETLGPLTMPRSLCGKEKFKPWSTRVSPRDMADIATQETINRISKSFSSWLKTLPDSGCEDAQWNEKDIRRIFDIFNRKDVRKVKQAKNWTKFGTSIKMVDRSLRNKVKSSHNTGTDVQKKLIAKTFEKCEDKLLNASVKESPKKKTPYGAYYLKPKTWSRTGQHQQLKEESLKEENVSGKVVEKTRNITTKSFEKYLKNSNQYEKSKVLTEILQ